MSNNHITQHLQIYELVNFKLFNSPKEFNFIHWFLSFFQCHWDKFWLRTIVKRDMILCFNPEKLYTNQNYIVKKHYHHNPAFLYQYDFPSFVFCLVAMILTCILPRQDCHYHLQWFSKYAYQCSFVYFINMQGFQL